jgi:hypothetical protein
MCTQITNVGWDKRIQAVKVRAASPRCLEIAARIQAQRVSVTLLRPRG